MGETCRVTVAWADGRDGSDKANNRDRSGLVEGRDKLGRRSRRAYGRDEQTLVDGRDKLTERSGN